MTIGGLPIDDPVQISLDKYAKATLSIIRAETQLEPDGNNCAVCGDSGHQAWECHHNPVAMMLWAERLDKILGEVCTERDGLLNENERLRGIIDSYGLTTKDGVTVKCTTHVFGPSAIEGDGTIEEVFVGAPHLEVLDEEGESTGEEWDLIENCYSTREAAKVAKGQQ